MQRSSEKEGKATQAQKNNKKHPKIDTPPFLGPAQALATSSGKEALSRCIEQTGC